MRGRVSQGQGRRKLTVDVSSSGVSLPFDHLFLNSLLTHPFGLEFLLPLSLVVNVVASICHRTSAGASIFEGRHDRVQGRGGRLVPLVCVATGVSGGPRSGVVVGAVLGRAI
jgi:hypothetical protein